MGIKFDYIQTKSNIIAYVQLRIENLSCFENVHNRKMYSLCVVLLCFHFIHYSLALFIPTINVTKKAETQSNTTTKDSISASSDELCSCGVFLAGQFKRATPKQPLGTPVILIEPDQTFPCNSIGVKKCTTKCLECLAPYLKEPSPEMICASVDREILKERTYLFVKNCNTDWISTRMSAGPEYCCEKSDDELLRPCSDVST